MSNTTEQLKKEIEEIIDKNLEGVVVSKGAIYRKRMYDQLLALFEREKREVVNDALRKLSDVWDLGLEKYIEIEKEDTTK